MTMSVEPLSPALGAEIKGVDLRRPLDDATVKAINAAFDQHVVVVFRDQDLSEADQLRAAGYFGKVHVRRRPANGRTPGGDYDTPFMMVTNIVENGKSVGAFGDGEMWFHHDTSYYPQPHRATFLYSMQLTSWGGETCFSIMYRAYDYIPRPLRDRLRGAQMCCRCTTTNGASASICRVSSSRRSSTMSSRSSLPIRRPAKRRSMSSRLMSARIEGFCACGKRGGAGAAVRYRGGSGDRLRARMAARRPRRPGQLVLDPCA